MLKIDRLTKNYGRFPALKGLSVEIPDAALHGFVGPNGAGKTTADLRHGVYRRGGYHPGRTEGPEADRLHAGLFRRVR